MERFKKLKVEKDNGFFYMQVKDNQENISFWIDCGLIDGYGNRDNFKTDDLYIDWDFNQYIFHLDNEDDIKAQEYQQNGDNIDALQEFIDEHNEELVAILRH